MNTRRLVTMAFLAWIAASMAVEPAAAQSQPIRLDGLDEYIRAMMAEWKVPGAAIAVVRDGKVLFARGFGYRNIQSREPVTEGTLFPIASCTKSFTAACLAILADEGRLDWNRPVRDYMPDFRLQDDDATRAIRPRDLVSHRTGLPRHDFVWVSTPLSRAEIFDRLKHLPLNRHVYDEYQYNNLMFMAAGVLVERLSGKTWEDFLREKILNPLGMKTAALTYAEMFKRPNYSLSYREEKGEPVEAGFLSNVDVIGPAGAVKASAAEMAQWLLVQLNRGRIGEQVVVSEKNLLMTRTPQTVVTPSDRKYTELGYATYGMGWNINTYQGRLMLSHGGSIEGFRNWMSLFPDDGLGIMLLTNTGAADYYFARAVSFFLADRLLQLQQVDWSARFKKEQAEQKAGEAKDASENAAKRQAGTRPSHPLDQLAGTYEHPAYGTLVLRETKESLQGIFHGRNFTLQHYHYDIFEGGGLFDGVKFAFQTASDGKIAGVVASIPSAGAIAFARKQPGAAPPFDQQGRPNRSRPGPWDNDVIIFRVPKDGSPERSGAFARAGVPAAARLKDGRLIAAHQHFPENDDANFDKVAVHFSTDEGRTWTDPQVIQVEGLPEGMRFPFDPTLVPLPDGRIRLYFTSLRGRRFEEDRPAIYSAVSEDGVRYRFEPGVRFGIEGRPVIDCAVVLHQGAFHLFAPDNGAGAVPGMPGGDSRPAADRPRQGTAYHATSKDGLNFTRREDVRLDENRRWLGNVQSDGEIMRFFGTGNPGGGGQAGGIWMAESRDGIGWEVSAGFPSLPGADPGAVQLKDGGWLLLVTGPPRPGTPRHHPAPCS